MCRFGDQHIAKQFFRRLVAFSLVDLTAVLVGFVSLYGLLEAAVRAIGQPPWLIDPQTAAEVLGSPINSLAWVANHLGARGLGLRAGDVVMTGSVSAVLRPKAGDAVRARFTRLGMVAARFV